MSDSIIRYQYNPMLTDTVGFFDYCIPLIHKSDHKDSLNKMCDYNIFSINPQSLGLNKIHQTTSAFSKHSLIVQHKDPLFINSQSFDWITIVFLTCIIIIAWIQTLYSKRLGQIFRAVAQSHYVNQLEREGNLFRERITLGLSFIYYACSSIFAYQLCNEFIAIPTSLNSAEFTGIIFVGLFIYQMFKTLLVSATGNIFENRESFRQYQLNTLMFNHVIGLVLFPVVVISFYWNSPQALIAGGIVVSLIFSYRLLRGILTGISNRMFNLFYLFLYLCTLEILPLLLLVIGIGKI